MFGGLTGQSPKPFAGLETSSGLLLAVSGGPDSLALMLLASHWAHGLSAPPPLYVATVDHRLRPESSTEAAHVAQAAKALGLPHVILPWLGEKPRTRVQERARTARYGLLAAHAGQIGATHLLTGHHADDQAETILFRLGRGSGLSGLAGMRRETAMTPALTLTRPLLDWSKADLIAICAAADLVVVDDASNRDLNYARARLRAQVGMAKSLGLDTPTLTRLGARLARADAALEAEARRRIDLMEILRAPRLFEASLAPLLDAEPDIVIRILRRFIAEVVGSDRAPRLDRLERLALAMIESGRAGVAYHATLAGTRLTLTRNARLTIVPEGIRRRGRL